MGFIASFVPAKLDGKPLEFIAVEAQAVPCLTKGSYQYDWADFNKLPSRIKMYSLGYDFVPPPIHSGGLRYHGKTPVLSALVHTEYILPAPESTHAVLAAIHEAQRAKEESCHKVTVFCLSGHGYLDWRGYASVFEI